MKIYIGFDDTDTKDSECGTGKLVRRFQQYLPEGCTCLGIVRQQLFVSEAIPYTTHNSAACIIAELSEPELQAEIIGRAAEYIEHYSVEGSDPGLCILMETAASIDGLIHFGQLCTHAVSSQKDAMAAAKTGHLSGHGGTNDGIIGAAAAVGLTLSGWAGRFIEFGDLRALSDELTVAELTNIGIAVVSMERDAKIPAPEDILISNGWLRPRLIGRQPVLFVSPHGQGAWRNIYQKRNHQSDRPALFNTHSHVSQSPYRTEAITSP